MEQKDTKIQLLEKAVRPELKVEKVDWDPPFLRIYDGHQFLVELWEADLKRMLGELLGIPLKV
jgi:hypothetical protein